MPDHSGKQGISPLTSDPRLEDFKGKSQTVAGPGRGFAVDGKDFQSESVYDKQ